MNLRNFLHWPINIKLQSGGSELQKSFVVNNSETESAFAEVITFIRERLKALKLKHGDINRARLMCEESLAKLIEYGDFSRSQAKIDVNIRKSFGDLIIDIKVPGQEFDFAESMQIDADEEFLKYKHVKKFNIVSVTALRSDYSSILKMLATLIFAVITGLLIKSFVPENIYMNLNNDILDPIRIIFINGLKMCAPPVVFFSIASCLTEFSKFSGLKRIGTRLIIYFVLIQFLASFVGVGLVKIFGTGINAHLQLSTVPSGEVQGLLNYIKELALKLIPENIISPFYEGNMLQLIILAVLTGTAAGALNAKIFCGLLNELSNLFMKITDILIKFVMFIVFCSVVSMVITTGISTILSVMGIFFTVIAAYASMNIIYCLIIIFLARLNPVHWLSKSMPIITTALATCSNSAVMPYSMKAARTMGIPDSVSSFAIPLGTALNKTAFSAYLGVAVISIANMYGINLSGQQIFSLCFSIVLIALGTPGMPGVGALSVLFTQAGCPLEAVVLLMGIEPILDIFDTMTTAMSNITMTLTATKHEGKLNIEVYNK